MEPLCADRPDLLEPLRALIEQYLSLSCLWGEARLPAPLAWNRRGAAGVRRLPDDRAHRRRRHGGGLQAPRPPLDRIVAAKIVRRDARWPASTGFLREARALALFSDRRIVRIFEFRRGDPPVIVMEYVEGFELGTDWSVPGVRAAGPGRSPRSATRCTTRTRSACSIAI